MAEGAVLEAHESTHLKDPFEEKGTCKVMVAEPSSGHVESIVHDNRLDFVMELARLERRSNFRFFTGNVHRLHVSYARELICDEAAKVGMDLVFMVDDDMIVPRRTFERLFETMQKTGADLVAPICTQRVHPFKPVLYRFKHKEEGGVRTFQNEFVEDYKPNETLEVDAVGFGVVLIKMDLIRKMKQPRFFSNTNIGEDIWFCYKAKAECGAKIVVDTSIKIGHMRPPEMATEYNYLKATNQGAKLKELYGHLEDRADKIEDINER